MPISQPPKGGTKFPRLTQLDAKKAFQAVPQVIPSNLITPIRGRTIVVLAIISSLCFIISLSFAFVGAEAGEPYFKRMLDAVAETSPGVHLTISNIGPDNLIFLVGCFGWRER